MQTIDKSINKVSFRKIEKLFLIFKQIQLCRANNPNRQINGGMTGFEGRLRQLYGEMTELGTQMENLTIFLNTDVTGKINGILKFLGVSTEKEELF